MQRQDQANIFDQNSNLYHEILLEMIVTLRTFKEEEITRYFASLIENNLALVIDCLVTCKTLGEENYVQIIIKSLPAEAIDYLLENQQLLSEDIVILLHARGCWLDFVANFKDMADKVDETRAISFYANILILNALLAEEVFTLGQQWNKNKSELRYFVESWIYSKHGPLVFNHFLANGKWCFFSDITKLLCQTLENKTTVEGILKSIATLNDQNQALTAEIIQIEKKVDSLEKKFAPLSTEQKAYMREYNTVINEIQKISQDISSLEQVLQNADSQYHSKLSYYLHIIENKYKMLLKDFERTEPNYLRSTHEVHTLTLDLLNGKNQLNKKHIKRISLSNIISKQIIQLEELRRNPTFLFPNLTPLSHPIINTEKTTTPSKNNSSELKSSPSPSKTIHHLPLVSNEGALKIMNDIKKLQLEKSKQYLRSHSMQPMRYSEPNTLTLLNDEAPQLESTAEKQIVPDNTQAIPRLKVNDDSLSDGDFFDASQIIDLPSSAWDSDISLYDTWAPFWLAEGSDNKTTVTGKRKTPENEILEAANKEERKTL